MLCLLPMCQVILDVLLQKAAFITYLVLVATAGNRTSKHVSRIVTGMSKSAMCSLYKHNLGLHAGLTTDFLIVVLQLGTAAIVWLDKAGLPLESQLPWELFSELVISSLLLPLKDTPPFDRPYLGFPITIPCNQVLTHALALLVSMTGSFLKQADQPDKQLTLHFQQWIMPMISVLLESYYGEQTVGGVAVLLMAVSVGQPCMRHLQLQPVSEETVRQGESCHGACCTQVPAKPACGRL